MLTSRTSDAFNTRQLWLGDIVAAGLLIVGISFSFWGVTVGWSNTIFDAHPFRQAQTAFTAYYLSSGGSFFKYETPLLGPPWRIPFEVPIYQEIVVVISKLFHEPLDQAGRLTSIAFFYATFLPLFAILRLFGISRATALITLTLFAVSPHYIFWSHTFMIESAALFFSVAYLALVVVATKRGSVAGHLDWPFILLCAVAGTLAGLTKVTTYVTLFLAAGVWIVYNAWKHRGVPGSRARAVVLLCVANVIPLLAILWWTSYSDSIKEMSAMGHFLTSRNLRSWNFGTLQQRFDIKSYSHFAAMGIGNVIDNIVGSRYLLLLALAAALADGRRRLLAFFVCLALYITSLAIFFNLHFVHTYYAYANGIFLVAAVGVGLGGLIDRIGWRYWLGLGCVVLAMAVCVHRYFAEYYVLQHTNAPGRPAAAAFLDRDTKPTDIIAIYGLDWSSQLPYQARRRALMAWKTVGEDTVDRSIVKLGAGHVSALVICAQERSRSAVIMDKWQALGFRPARSITADDCEIYER